MDSMLTGANSEIRLKNLYGELQHANQESQALEANAADQIKQLTADIAGDIDLKHVTARTECMQVFTALCLSEVESTRSLFNDQMKEILQNADLLQGELKDARVTLRDRVETKGITNQELTEQEVFLAQNILLQGSERAKVDVNEAWMKVGALNAHLSTFFSDQWKKMIGEDPLLPIFSDARKFIVVAGSEAWQQLGGSIEERMAKVSQALQAQQGRDQIWAKLGVDSQEKAIGEVSRLQEAGKAPEVPNHDEALTKTRTPLWQRRNVWLGLGLGTVIGGLVYADLRRENSDGEGSSFLVRMGAALASSRIGTYIPVVARTLLLPTTQTAPKR